MNEIRDTTAWIGHGLIDLAYEVFLSFGPLAPPLATGGSLETERCRDGTDRETGADL